MQARFSPLDMAMTCHGMVCGFRYAAGWPLVPAPWAQVSTAFKAAAIAEVEAVLRGQYRRPEGAPPDELVEADLFTLIVGRMAAELR